MLTVFTAPATDTWDVTEADGTVVDHITITEPIAASDPEEWAAIAALNIEWAGYHVNDTRFDPASGVRLFVVGRK